MSACALEHVLASGSFSCNHAGTGLQHNSTCTTLLWSTAVVCAAVLLPKLVCATAQPAGSFTSLECMAGCCQCLVAAMSCCDTADCATTLCSECLSHPESAVLFGLLFACACCADECRQAVQCEFVCPVCGRAAAGRSHLACD
jgi:hypothetical protein